MKNLWLSVLAWALAVLVAIALAVATPSDSLLIPASAQASPSLSACFAGLPPALRPANKCASGHRLGRL